MDKDKWIKTNGRDEWTKKMYKDKCIKTKV